VIKINCICYYEGECLLFSSCYEGQVCNGVRHGVGTLTCADGVHSYTGDWCMGKITGKVRYTIVVGQVNYCRQAKLLYRQGSLFYYRQG